MNRLFKKIKRLFMKDTTENLIDDILSTPEAKLESKLRKIGFLKLTENCYKPALHSRKTTLTIHKLEYLVANLSVSDIKTFTNDKYPYHLNSATNIERNEPIYFYLNNFFISLYKKFGIYHAFYVTDDKKGCVSRCSKIIYMEIDEIAKFLGDLNDSNIKELYRNNKIDELLDYE